MAEVTTQTSIQPLVAPFNTSGIRNISNSSVPFALCSHVKTFTVPAVGSGDSGKLLCTLVIPPNYLFQLSGFHIDQRATSEPKWDQGIFSIAYTGQNSFVPGYAQNTQNFPIAVTSNAGIGTNQYKNASIASAGDNSAYNVNSPVNFLVSSDASNPQNVLISMYSTVSTAHAAEFNVAVNWKMFDISQGNHPFLPSL